MEALSWPVVFGVIVVGFGSGVLSGMFGIGGAIITTPGIRALGAAPLDAVGSTVPAILPGAISGTIRYAKAGIVNWRIGVVCGLSGTILAILGANVADLVNAHYLMLLTALLVGWSGINVYRSKRHSSPPEVRTNELPVVSGRGATNIAVQEKTRTYVPTVTLIAVGAAAGFLAGLLGVGGGVVMMPAFTNVLKIPVKEAVASSLVAVSIFSTSALISHALLGHMDWRFSIPLVVGVIPGALAGSKFTISASDTAIRHLFGLFLVVMASIYGITELYGLR